MISLKIKKYRPYADVTMVVNVEGSITALPGLEIHLGMLDEDSLERLLGDLEVSSRVVENVLWEYAEDE